MQVGFSCHFFHRNVYGNFAAVGAGANCSKSSVFLGWGWGGAAWKPAKLVLAGKLEEQGDRAVSAALCYRVLTGTRARIWVKNNRCTNVALVNIFENALKKVNNRQKQPK